MFGISEEPSQREIEELRARIWKRRNRNSRATGVALLIFSGAVFLVGFTTSSLLPEMTSLTAFILGSFLLVSDFEQRVKLFPSSEAIEGPVKSTILLLREKGWAGRAKFVVKEDGARMMPESFGGPSYFPIELTPYGHGFVEFYESELGSLQGRGLEFLREWLPRILRDRGGLVESVSIAGEKGEVETKLVRPFVRPLCIKPFFTENVCNSIGCPLVNSIGEAIALSTGTNVSHVRCRYDPLTQTATALHTLS